MDGQDEADFDEIIAEMLQDEADGAFVGPLLFKRVDAPPASASDRPSAQLTPGTSPLWLTAARQKRSLADAQSREAAAAALGGACLPTAHLVACAGSTSSPP